MPFVLEKKSLLRKRNGEGNGCPAETAAQKALRLAAAVIRRGNRSRIVVRSEDAVIIDTPVTAGLLAALASPKLFLFGVAAVLLGPWGVDILKPEDRG